MNINSDYRSFEQPKSILKKRAPQGALPNDVAERVDVRPLPGERVVIDLTREDDERARKVRKALSYSNEPLPNQVIGFQIDEGSVDGLELLAACLKSESYKEAFTLSQTLYDDTKTHPSTTRQVLQFFNEVLNRGEKTLGREYYAWLLYTVTYHQELDNKVSTSIIIEGYKKSANSGFVEARYELAQCLTSQVRLKEAHDQWILYMHESSNPSRAYPHIGALYEKGDIELPRDLDKAIKYYKKGTEAGCALSTYKLAKLTQNCVTQNTSEIKSLYRKAGQLGHAKAWMELALIYQRGWKCTEVQGHQYDPKLIDLGKAEYCIREAYKLDPNNKEHAAALAEVILDNPAQTRTKEGLEYLERAKALGSHKAFYRSGLIHRNGKHGIEKDPKKAIEDFEQIERINDGHEPTFVDGLFCLAELYVAQKDLSSLDKAVGLLIKAGAFCSEWTNWRDPSDNYTIHKALPAIKNLLTSAQKARVNLMVKTLPSIDSPEEKQTTLYKIHRDCVSVFKHKHLCDDQFLSNFNFVLEVLITFAISRASTPAGSPIKPKESKVNFEADSPEKKARAEKKRSPLEDCEGYLSQLGNLKEASPYFIRTTRFQLAELYYKKTLHELPLDQRFDFLRKGRDLILEVSKTHNSAEVKQLLKNIYFKYGGAYLLAYNATNNADEKIQYFQKAQYYQNLAKSTI